MAAVPMTTITGYCKKRVKVGKIVFYTKQILIFYKQLMGIINYMYLYLSLKTT